MPRICGLLLTDHCQIKEVTLFPDHIFRFSDHECAVILGKKAEAHLQTSQVARDYAVYEKKDRDFFQTRLSFHDGSRGCPHATLCEIPHTASLDPRVL